MPGTNEPEPQEIVVRRRPAHVPGGPGCLGLLALIVAIVLVCMWFVARTHHFRAALAEELRASTGLIVKCGHTAMKFPYDLVATGVVATGEGSFGGSVTLNEVRLALRPDGPLVLRCEGGEVRFVRHSETGVWDPAPLADWAAMQAPSEAGALLETFPRWLRIEAREMRVSWQDEKGVVWRSWSNATLKFIPVSLPGRPGWVIDGSVAQIVEGGRTGIECRLEWLTCRGQPYLKLAEHGVWNDAAGTLSVATGTNRTEALLTNNLYNAAKP